MQMNATIQPDDDRQPRREPLPAMTLLRLDPMQRIERLREGLETGTLVEISKAIGRPVAELLELLQLSPGSPVTVRNKNARLTTQESERVLAFLRIIQSVEDMVANGGDNLSFDAPRWTANWFARPCPALGGRRPADLADTLEGYRVLNQLIAQLSSGAYS